MERNKMKRIGRGEIIWRDSRAVDNFKLILVILFLILGFWFLINSGENRILTFIFIVMFLFFLYTQLRKKHVFITAQGIRMGNLIYWADEKLSVKQKATFFEWNKIKSINILLKSYRKGIYGGRDFYHIHLKPEGKHRNDCLIYNPEGFIQALKSLKKDYLLDKKSREKYA